MLNLAKEKEINLTKSAPALTNVKVGLSWDEGADLDASIILLNESGKMIGHVFYDNYKDKPEAGIEHSGDARNGQAEGDDEIITVDLNAINPDAKTLVFTISSHVDDGDAVMFGSTCNPVAKLYDGDKVLIQAKLDEEAAFGTSMDFVSLTKNDDGEWIYKNLSETIGSSPMGFGDIFNKYK